MAKQPTITLVVPVLNNLSGLKRALASVTSANVQIVVVDGGSTDGISEIISSHKWANLTLVSQNSIGIAGAFNEGIALAQGRYVCCMGSDDVWTPRMNSFVSNLSAEGGADIYFGSARFVEPNSEGNGRIRTARPSMLWFRMWVFHSAMIVSKRTYDLVGVYAQSYSLAMDSHWVHRAVARGCKYVVVDEVWSEVSLGGESDRNYLGALREYRTSLVENEIASPLVASLGYLIVAMAKRVRRLING